MAMGVSMGNLEQVLQEISDIVRWKGVFSEYDRCAGLISELLQTKDAALIKDILMNFVNPVYLKDVCSDYLWCSATYANWLALSDAKKIIGKNDFDFGLDLHMATDVQEADELALLEGKTTAENREVNFPDGTTRHLLTKRYPVYNAQGHIIGLLGVIREIFTPVVEASEALKILSEASAVK